MTLAVVALAGCTKYSVECELVVQPRVMISAGSGSSTPAYMARVYAWYIDDKDIANWRPGSYADAEAGLVRHRTTGEVRSHGLMAVQRTDFQSVEDSYVHLIISRSPVLLVAVDPVNRFYGYRKFEYKVPWDRALVPVTFKTWQLSYDEYGWKMISELSEQPSEEQESE